MRSSRDILVLILELVCLALLSACAGGGSAGPQTPGPAPSLTTRGQNPGIELCWWIVSDINAGGRSVDQVLEPYASRAVPVSWRSIEAWHANGLRVMSVPVDEVEPLREALRTVGPIQNQWLGQANRWTEIARGPRIEGAATIGLDQGALELRDGQLRLAMRCWSTPAPWSGADTSATVGALQLELVPMFVPAPPAKTTSFVLPTDAPRQEPLLFSRLLLEATLLGEDAILIVSEGPREDTGAAAGKGPQDVALPTLGESLLLPDDGVRRPDRRVIVILTPSVPREFRLLAQDSVR